MVATQKPPSPLPASRPGLPLVGAIAIAVGLTIIVAAVLAVFVGDKAPTPPATTQSATQRGADTPDGASDPQNYQLVRSRDGSMAFEAPLEWSTRVEVSGTTGSDHVAGAGAVATTLDDYKAAKTDGIVAVVTDPTTSTSAGLVGAVIGNSSLFCPAAGCTTGKPTEKDVQLPSPVEQVDSQFTVSEPAADGSPGELRYTIETAAPTRYVVMIVRASDPSTGADALEHAVGSLTLS